MFDRLAGGALTVVANSAAAQRYADVIEACPSPRNLRGVASAARQGGLRVFGGLEGDGEAATLAVTDIALAWCALEDALQMAGLAISLGMSPEQRKAGLNVIEARSRALFRGGGRGGEHQKRQRQHSCKEFLFHGYRVDHGAPRVHRLELLFFPRGCG